MIAYETLLVERDGPVGWLVFDRPDAAQRDGRHDDRTSSRRAWRELDADPDVRVIVNTGDGRRVPDRARRRAAEPRPRGAARAVAAARENAELRFTAWHNEVWKPVIAAVNGVCAGGGLHFVADADIVIAARDATFLDPHVSVGQVDARTRRSRWCRSRRWSRSCAWRSSGATSG